MISSRAPMAAYVGPEDVFYCLKINPVSGRGGSDDEKEEGTAASVKTVYTVLIQLE